MCTHRGLPTLSTIKSGNKLINTPGPKPIHICHNYLEAMTRFKPLLPGICCFRFKWIIMLQSTCRKEKNNVCAIDIKYHIHIHSSVITAS